jgi:hypothetical protein
MRALDQRFWQWFWPENFAKTSTWWGEKKAGKGTHRAMGCQAARARFARSRAGADIDAAVTMRRQAALAIACG